jgi:branched-chain amino acid aminotransferase
MFLTYFVQQDIPARDAYQKGVHTILFSAERKNPHVKAIQTSYRERAATTRDTTGAYEALLVDGSGHISEGTRSNIFYLLDNQLCTPPSGSVLLGVTRQHVMSICREIGLKSGKESYTVTNSTDWQAPLSLAQPSMFCRSDPLKVRIWTRPHTPPL